MPGSGGEPQPITNLDGTELGHKWPSFTPDGLPIVFTALGGGPRNTHIDVIERKTGHRRRFENGATLGRVLASGHLVYLDRFYSRLVAAAIDVDLELIGRAIPLIEGVSTSASQSFEVSRTGTLAYVAAGLGEARAVSCRSVSTARWPNWSTAARAGISLDRPRMAGTWSCVRSPMSVEWLCDLERRNLTPLTTSGDNHQPIWTQSGREVVYGREDTANGDRGLFRQVADGSRAGGAVGR